MTGDAQAARWRDAAVDDLRHARYAEDGGFYAHACYGLEAWTPATGFGARQAASAIAGASAILTAARRHSSSA